MKRLISFLVCILMIFILPKYAVAEEEIITQDSTDKSGQISIDYSIDESYTVIIPANVTFTDETTTVVGGLQVSDVMIKEGKTLKVNVTSLNNFKMINGDGYINYSLLVNSNELPETNSCDVIVVHAGEHSGWAVLNFVTGLDKENALYAGAYNDTLTFTVSID